MKLFEDFIDKTKNWLPRDGTVNYYGKLFDQKEADFYLQTLLTTIDWRNDEAVIFGKKIITKRKVAWYGEKPNRALCRLGNRIPSARTAAD